VGEPPPGDGRAAGRYDVRRESRRPRDRFEMVVPSPVGELWLTGDGTHLTGLWFGPPPRLQPGAQTPATADPERAPVAGVAPFPEVRAQLEAYFAGRRRDFDLPLAPAGTPFQRRVWQALREIPYGQTVSYGVLAARLGQPGAGRAVGLANGQNPISIVIPCHRVIGAGGALTGYGGGLERKRWLLALESGAARQTGFDL
jgi:methylated-DNA-[protein]-cysteine S-methyltransferase